jgi:hypothetical protein
MLLVVCPQATYYIKYDNLKSVFNKKKKKKKEVKQYQQKMNHHLSPQTIKHKKTITYGIKIPGPGMGQAQKGGRVEPVNEICNMIT